MDRYTIEAQLIGTWLQGKAKQFIQLFTEDDFKFFRLTYQKIRSLFRENKDFSPALVAGEYKLHELAQIMTSAFPTQFEGHATELRRMIDADKLMKILNSKPTKDPYETAANIISELQKIQPVKIKKNSILDDAVHFSEGFTLGWPKEEALFNSGLPILDRKMKGFKRGHLITIAARTGQGKSALAIQLSWNALRKENKVLYVSKEMTSKELFNRLFRHQTLMSLNELEEGLQFDTTDMSDEEIRKEKDRRTKMFVPEIEAVSAMPMIFDTMSSTVPRIRCEAIRNNVDVVIVDYIGLLSDESSNIRDRFINITRGLKMLAQELNVPVIQLAQIRRSSEGEIPGLEHLKESSSIEEDSNEVIILHFMNEKQALNTEAVFSGADYKALCESGRRPYLVKLEKNRDGEVGTVKAIFEPARHKFTEMERRY